MSLLSDNGSSEQWSDCSWDSEYDSSDSSSEKSKNSSSSRKSPYTFSNFATGEYPSLPPEMDARPFLVASDRFEEEEEAEAEAAEGFKSTVVSGENGFDPENEGISDFDDNVYIDDTVDHEDSINVGDSIPLTLAEISEWRRLRMNIAQLERQAEVERKLKDKLAMRESSVTLALRRLKEELEIWEAAAEKKVEIENESAISQHVAAKDTSLRNPSGNARNIRPSDWKRSLRKKKKPEKWSMKTMLRAGGSSVSDTFGCPIKFDEENHSRHLVEEYRVRHASRGNGCIAISTSYVDSKWVHHFASAWKASSPGLRSLNLSGCCLGNEGCASLASALCSRVSECLETLNLSRCLIGNDGCRFIGDAVGVNCSLRQINLSSNLFDGDALGRLGAATVTHTCLQQLDVSSNTNTRRIRRLAGGIARNCSLSLIDFSSCSLELESWPYIGEMLSGVDGGGCFKSLHLCRSNVNSEAVACLRGALNTCNDMLRYLNLSNNDLQDRGICEFAELCPQLRSLQTLLLDCVKLSSSGARFISKVTETLPSLDTLSLCRNCLGDEGAVHVSAALAFGRPASLRLRYCEIESKGFRCILTGGAHLETLDFDGNHVESWPSLFEFPSNLRELTVAGNLLSDDSLPRIKTFVLGCLKLSKLHLQANELTGLARSILTAALSRPVEVVLG